MKRNKKIILILIVGIILSITIITQYDKSSNLQTDTKNYLSIMVKSDEGTYKVMNTIPTEGYVLNKTKSKCENGSTLSWKEGKISITGNKQDKCHIYLEKEACKENETIEKCLKRKDVNSTLLFHNGTIEIDGKVMDAGDYSYRYSGASEKVNNYVCFGGECSNDPTNENYANLYRIIGLFPTEETKNSEQKTYQMKIIKADYATETELGGTGVGAYAGTFLSKELYEQNETISMYKGNQIYLNKVTLYHWNNKSETNSDNDWKNSNLNIENLNEYYLNYIKNKEEEKWEKMMENHTWTTAGNLDASIRTQNAKNAYNNEIKEPNKGTALSSAATEVTARVGLMYISDYMYAATKESWTTVGSVKDNNWLYMGLSEWLITRGSNYNNRSYYIWGNGSLGVGHSTVYSFDLATRPVMYLNSNVKISSGSGTSEDPYILSV